VATDGGAANLVIGVFDSLGRLFGQAIFWCASDEAIMKAKAIDRCFLD
jgi:hypothetical protein